MEEHRFDLLADFHQFLLLDASGAFEDLHLRWSEEAVQEMFVQGDDYVAVGTARNMPVPVVVRVRDEAPDGVPLDVDRVREGRLPLPSGELIVTGVTDNELSGGRITVAPGDYDVRVLYRGLDTLSEDGLEGEDSYEVDLWPKWS